MWEGGPHGHMQAIGVCMEGAEDASRCWSHKANKTCLQFRGDPATVACRDELMTQVVCVGSVIIVQATVIRYPHHYPPRFGVVHVYVGNRQNIFRDERDLTR